MHVEFYVFENANEAQIEVALCQLIEKWYREMLSIAILCPSKEKADFLDQLLWSFSDQSFVPHALCNEANLLGPVLLCLNLEELGLIPDVIINLSKEIITTIKPSRLLVEIVFPDQTMQQLARDRYKHYRNEGYQLKTIKMPVSKVSASCR